jgi:GNAT superfamily N-acetyltransferase
LRIDLDLSPHDAGVRSAVDRLLTEADQEFVPALSSRADTRTLSMTPDPSAGTTAYADAMAKEQWFVAVRNDQVVGVLSFLSPSGAAGGGCGPAYVTTIVVARSERRHGIGIRLYDALEEFALSEGLTALETRTWSTNRSHLNLLNDRGFVETQRVADERAVGVDTVQLVKHLRSRDGIVTAARG